MRERMSPKAGLIIALILGLFLSFSQFAIAQDSFAKIITSIGSNETTLMISRQNDITTDLVIPSNITLQFLQGGSLNIADSKTVTINGHVEAGLYQIFKWTGTGKVVLGAHSVKEAVPQWWGALGNGSTDDTIAIQAALDSLTGGGVVFLPPGSYKISHISISVSTTTLYGNGFGVTSLLSTHLYADGPTPPIVRIQAGCCVMRGISVGYITAPNWDLGYVNSHPVNETHPISISTAGATPIDNCVVEKCLVNGSLCHGIAIGAGRNNIIQDNIIVNVTATAIYGLYCDQLIIQGNKIEHSRDSGIYVDGTIGEGHHDILIKDNIVIDPNAGGIGAGHISNISISGNTIDNTWSQPILLDTCSRAIISDNVVHDAYANYAAGPPAGIIHATPCGTGGGIYGCIDVNLVNTYGVGECIISGNLCNIVTASDMSYRGIYVHSGNEIIITGNKITASIIQGGFGVTVSQNDTIYSTHFLVSGNSIKGFYYGIGAHFSLIGTINSNLIEEAEIGFYVPSSDSVTIIGNTLYDVTAEISSSGATNLNYFPMPTEGTWTPGISFGGGTTGITYTTQAGLWTKIGNLYHVTGYILLSNKGSSTGAAKITGLPAAVINNAGAYAPCALFLSGITFANQYAGVVDLNATTISLYETTEAGVDTTIADTDFTNTSTIMISAMYRVL